MLLRGAHRWQLVGAVGTQGLSATATENENEAPSHINFMSHLTSILSEVHTAHGGVVAPCAATANLACTWSHRGSQAMCSISCFGLHLVKRCSQGLQ